MTTQANPNESDTPSDCDVGDQSVVQPSDGSGYYWVYYSCCCQTPPMCDEYGLHGPPGWSVSLITEHGVMIRGEYVPFDKFVGHIGQKIEKPKLPPDVDESKWNESHYTLGGH